MQLSRQLYASLQSDDVVVADSAYGTYVDLVLVIVRRQMLLFTTTLNFSATL